jgi:hypothetical protein
MGIASVLATLPSSSRLLDQLAQQGITASVPSVRPFHATAAAALK